MREIYGLIGLGFLFAGGFSIISPILPAIAAEFNVGPAGAGLAISAYAASRMLVAIPFGMLANRSSTYRLVQFACALIAAGSLLAVLASSFGVLLLGRVIQGAGSSVFIVATTGRVIDVAPPESRARILALYQSMLLAGMSVSPALGGVSALYFGYRGPFLIQLAYALLGLAIVKVVLQPQEQQPREAKETGSSSRSVGAGAKLLPLREIRSASLGNIAILLVVTATTAGILRSGIKSAAAPIQAAQSLGLSPPEVGFVLMVAGLVNLVMIYPIGAYIDRHGWRRTLPRAMALNASAVFALAVAKSFVPFVLALITIAVVTGFLTILGSIIIAEATPKKFQKSFVGLERAIRDLAAMWSPPVLLLLAGAWGFSAMYLLAASVIIALGAISLFATRRAQASEL